jgi:hypothetical protein
MLFSFGWTIWPTNAKHRKDLMSSKSSLCHVLKPTGWQAIYRHYLRTWKAANYHVLWPNDRRLVCIFVHPQVACFQWAPANGLPVGIENT